MSDGRTWTRRMYLQVRTMEALPDSMHPTSKLLMAMEAVSSTAIEHPEWDMEEKRTWEEWEEA